MAWIGVGGEPKAPADRTGSAAGRHLPSVPAGPLASDELRGAGGGSASDDGSG